MNNVCGPPRPPLHHCPSIPHQNELYPFFSPRYLKPLQRHVRIDKGTVSGPPMANSGARTRSAAAVLLNLSRSSWPQLLARLETSDRHEVLSFGRHIFTSLYIYFFSWQSLSNLTRNAPALILSPPAQKPTSISSLHGWIPPLFSKRVAGTPASCASTNRLFFCPRVSPFFFFLPLLLICAPPAPPANP